MNPIKPQLIAAALATLTACMDAGSATAPGSIPTSATAGPGSVEMSAFDAGVIFADTCLIRGANFEHATEGLRVHNMTQNSATGTYFHNRSNLSVKVTSQQCSMVFATSQPMDEVVAALAQGTTSIQPDVPRGIDISSRPWPDGQRYFRVAIQSPVSG